MSRIVKQLHITVLSAICAVCLLLTGWSMPVHAAMTGSIHISYVVTNTKFSLYQLATLDENKQYTVNQDFTGKYTVLTEATADELREQASDMKDVVDENDITAYMTIETDNKGEGDFTSLPQGVYLLIGEEFNDGEAIYTPTPTIYYIPMTDANGVTGYKIDAEVKYEWNPITPPPTITPPEEPDEPEPEEPEEPEPEEPETPEEPPVTPPVTPKTPIGTLINILVPKAALPQTGQLWWPILVMVVAGGGMIVVGLHKRKKESSLEG